MSKFNSKSKFKPYYSTWGMFPTSSPEKLEGNGIRRLWHATKDICGYASLLGFPAISLLFGMVRIIDGFCILLSACIEATGHRNPFIIGLIPKENFSELLFYYGIKQIVRGSLEAFVPFGCLVNLALDSIFTANNLIAHEEMTNKDLSDHFDKGYSFI